MGRHARAVAIALLVALQATAPLAAEIKVGGTGAALGILIRLSEAHRTLHPQDSIDLVPGLGSSGALAALGEGVLQIAVSSRALRAEERANGLDSTPFLVTPLLFVTSHMKPQTLTRAEVVDIFDGTLTKWPDGQEIRPVLRPRSDSVVPFLISSFPGMEAAMEKTRRRPDVPVAATDQDNLAIAEKIPNSFTTATLTQVTTEIPRLRRVALDGVDASIESMENTTYPLKMRIDLVARANPSPEVQRVLAFLRSPEADRIVRQGGAVPAPNAAAGGPAAR